MFAQSLVVPTKCLAGPWSKRESASCFCAPRFAARTARTIGHGRLSKTGAFMMAAWFNGRCFILERINDSQRAAWSKAIGVFDEGAGQSKQIALFPADRLAPALDCDVVSIRLSAMRLRRPRQWGACWMATLLWNQLRLDEFWLAALAALARGNELAEHSEDIGWLPVDFSWQRMEIAPTLVRA